MTDASLPVTTFAGYQQHPLSAPPVTSLHLGPSLSTSGSVDVDDDGEINCICAYQEDDGSTIQCDICNKWQHVICYYPNEADVPGDNDKHYCIDCDPDRHNLDARKATERQRRALNERSAAIGHLKRTASKTHKKRQKTHRKSASPRDLPPPAKKPKTSHRASASVTHTRKRNGTVTHHSSSRSPDPPVSPGPSIPWYTDDFRQAYDALQSHTETESNLLNNIAVTNSLSLWLADPDAVIKETGCPQSSIFKKWNGSIDEIPGRPATSIALGHDEGHPYETNLYPTWASLITEEQLGPGSFIGELKGHIGFKDDYREDPDNRWFTLRHPEPFVFFHQQLPIYVDARQEGSMFRYVRRSCSPNAELQTIITDPNEYHFCFMATKEIMPGEEVTVPWQIHDSVKEKLATAINVTSGTLGQEARNYVSNWCDMDEVEAAGKPAPIPRPQRRVISVTQRLLQRCATNNFKRKAESEDSSKLSETKEDTAMVDNSVTVSPMPVTAPESPRVDDPTDVPMADNEVANKDAVPVVAEVSSSVSPRGGSPVEAEAAPISYLPAEPPAPPWPQKALSSVPVKESTPPPTTASRQPKHHRVNYLHMEMPPPPLNPFNTQPSTSGTPQTAGAVITPSIAQSPLSLTPGAQPFLFSPNVQAAVGGHGPARKKMSLSDYTKRSKARETEVGREGSPASTSSAVVSSASADQALQGSAIESPRPANLTPEPTLSANP
ncbi:SET domain-containing protein 3 [Taxawa tesnikishii (nom. ined.)]|nr:SET domain-containing protein 3 [Dothideales sp. JES 119]